MATEKEKMLSSALFKAFEKELSGERMSAKELLALINSTSPNEQGKRTKLFKELLGKTPKSFYIEPTFNCDFGYNIEIGKQFYANTNLTILDCAKVSIGEHVFIGPNVNIYAVSHPIHHVDRNTFLEFGHPVSIGDNVWREGTVMINQGISIGNH